MARYNIELPRDDWENYHECLDALVKDFPETTRRKQAASNQLFEIWPGIKQIGINLYEASPDKKPNELPIYYSVAREIIKTPMTAAERQAKRKAKLLNAERELEEQKTQNKTLAALLRDCESYAGAMVVLHKSGEGAQLAARCRDAIAEELEQIKQQNHTKIINETAIMRRIQDGGKSGDFLRTAVRSLYTGQPFDQSLNYFVSLDEEGRLLFLQVLQYKTTRGWSDAVLESILEKTA